MEKVRFEAFNVEELRVLRRACYEAGAAEKARGAAAGHSGKGKKAAQPAESAHRAPEPPVEAKFTGFLYVRCEKCGQERGFCAKTPISSCYCRECGGKTELKNMRQVKIWCECGSAYRYHTNIQDAAFDMPCLNCEAPVALEWNENKNRYQPMNSEPPKARRGRK